MGIISKLIVGASLAYATPTTVDPLWTQFEAFKKKFELEFDSLEENTKRFKIFVNNMQLAEELTKKSKGKTQFGATKYAHLTREEFKKTYLGYKRTEKGDNLKKSRPVKKFPMRKSTPSVDWRGTLATPVKDQGQCGSCWAFSATEAVETAYWKATGSEKILAPQQVTSCDDVDYGCNGGNTETAYDYYRQAGGVELEKDYPYTSGTTERTGMCKANPNKFKVKVGATTTISSGPDGEDNMLNVIQDTPMSICVDAEPWQLYFGGVIDASTCGTELDHCVHLVGYNSEENYWIVKNSWNTNWGEDGYIYVRTGENACGVAEDVTIVEASDEDAVMDEDPRISIFKGVIKGMGIDVGPDCISYSEDLMAKIHAAFVLIEKKDKLDMAHALQILAMALSKDARPAMDACKAAEEQVEKLLKALAIVENPKEFIYHVGQDLKVNGVDIFKQVNAAVGFHKTQQYEPMGEAIGTALELILIGNPDSIFV